ncbi:MAG TPA: DUF418 domain-containing protein [Cyclobacteriaceae bacterium]
MSGLLKPVDNPKRIVSLDLLRGIAILGILIMNIQSFAMPGAAYLNPTAYGSLDGVNKWVWIVSHVLADQKFMAIFSVLFGAGIVLITQKAESKTGKSSGLHYRRTLWLLIIGLIHAHIIWYGDILVAYAICALFIYLFRKMGIKKLVIFGILLLSIHTLIYYSIGASIPMWSQEDLASTKSGWQPTNQEIEEEINAITGSLSEQISKNSESAFFLEIYVFLMLFLWRVGGLMLIGMALFKSGILTGSKSRAFYTSGFLISFPIGLLVVAYGLFENFQAEWSIEYSMFHGSQFNYWGSLFVSFGYICLIMLFAKSTAFKPVKERLAAVGQMALTNYILQSIIGILLFYGVGFELFGKLDRISQIGIVLVLWVMQIAWSKPWLDHFRFGPLEWLWRSLTYGKKQPFIRTKSFQDMN